MVETVGVIDIGTNSARLLIGRVYSGDRLEVVRTALETTRLGENLAGGRLLERAMDRTIKCLQAYRKLLESAGTDEVVVAATAAVREAGNRERFLELVKEMTGLSVRVLSGREEAVYGYLGVISGLGVDPGETVVVDVGGGSTEFVWTQAGSPVFRSLPLGAVRMTEQEYTDAQMAAIIGTAAEEAAGLRHGRLVGVGGTVTTLAAMARQLAVYDPERVHGFRLGREEVDRILGRIEAVGVEERSRIPGLQPERADIIVTGARIVRLVMRVLDVTEMTVSEADILHGLALYGRRVSKEKA